MAERTRDSGSKTFINDATLAHDQAARNSKAVDTELGERGTPAQSLWTHLMADVDPNQSTGPLAAFCFMTGYMCVSFPPSNLVNERLPNLAMLYLFHLSSYGVVFKLATLSRCA
jgi:hypothetical protein